MVVISLILENRFVEGCLEGVDPVLKGFRGGGYLAGRRAFSRPIAGGQTIDRDLSVRVTGGRNGVAEVIEALGKLEGRETDVMPEPQECSVDSVERVHGFRDRRSAARRAASRIRAIAIET